MPRIEPFDEDLDILQKLDDVPALPYQAMQREFDKSGNIIKDFLNNVIIPTINSIIAVTGETDKTLTVSDAPADAFVVGNKIKQLATEISKKLDKAGGTITGKLIIPAQPVDPADCANKKYVDESRKILHAIPVSKSSWVTDGTFSDFPFRADVQLAGVTASMIPDVTFPVSDTEFCPVAESYNGGVTVWADEANDVTIPTIILIRGDGT